MAERIQINVAEIYMNLDGQWQTVQGGSVVDVESASKYAGLVTKLTEVAGPLGPKGSAASVRGVKTR